MNPTRKKRAELDKNKITIECINSYRNDIKEVNELRRMVGRPKLPNETRGSIEWMRRMTLWANRRYGSNASLAIALVGAVITPYQAKALEKRRNYISWLNAFVNAGSPTIDEAIRTQNSEIYDSNQIQEQDIDTERELDAYFYEGTGLGEKAKEKVLDGRIKGLRC